VVDALVMLGPSLLERIVALTHWHFIGAVTALALLAWTVELVLRRRWNASRRLLMETQVLGMRNALLLAFALWGTTQTVLRLQAGTDLSSLVGFLAIVTYMAAGLRVARVCFFQWLFANSQREGVPLLLVDVFTFLASAVMFGVLLHAVFLIEVTSLLATSAVLSVVLGLALQDTLGHLFAGISLQLDRPFRLGDWIEVRVGSDRISGQVLELSWRATLLLAVGEELVTVPNKTMAQGLLVNFSGRERPFVRGHVFRFPLDVDVGLVKQLLTRAALETAGIAHDPKPVPLLIETTESWLTIKMVNFVTDYGTQYAVGDAYQVRALELLAEQKIQLAAQRIQVVR
jgi:small-conductance mechanosensitive channel